MTEESHRKRNKKYNIEGHAYFLTCSCYRRMPLLTNDLWREWLAESIREACAKHSVAVWAYVFMPEHFHLLLKPRRAQYDLAKFEQAFKVSSSRKIIHALLKSKSPEQWRWSSYRWLVDGRREGEPMRVDDWDETLISEPDARA